MTESRGTCLELSCSSVSTTADLATKCWQWMEIATKRSSIVEWILPCFCLAQGGSLVNFALVCT